MDTPALRAAWAVDRCNEGSLVPLRWSISGTSQRVNRRALDAFVALDRALFAAGYRTVQRPDPVQTFNCRAIDEKKKCQSDGTNCSLHAYGIAVDIDPNHNPHEHGDPFSGRIQPVHVTAAATVRTTDGLQVFRWGGVFSKPDRMHFEVQLRPGFQVAGATGVTAAAPAEQLTTVTHRVTAASLRLRSDPSLEAEVLARLPNGDGVRRLADEAREADDHIWFKVQAAVGGRIEVGWAASTHLVAVAPIRVTHRVKVQRTLRLRSDPSLDAPVVTTLANGTGVEQLPDAPVTADDHLWFKVQTLDAVSGWVASSFLTAAG